MDTEEQLMDVRFHTRAKRPLEMIMQIGYFLNREASRFGSTCDTGKGEPLEVVSQWEMKDTWHMPRASLFWIINSKHF